MTRQLSLLVELDDPAPSVFTPRRRERRETLRQARLRAQHAQDVDTIEAGGVVDRDPRWERGTGRRRFEVVDSPLLNGD